MENTFSEIKAKIESARMVIITSHDRPDGDAIGATLGLHRILKNLGVKSKITGCQPIPDHYRFILEGDVFLPLEENWIADSSLMVILDCGNSDRAEFADIWRNKGGFSINIDHHKSNSGFGDINLIDPSASSTSELIVRLCQYNNWEIVKSAANPLYGGIITDTGRFTFENTSSMSLEAAATLVAAGANPSEVGTNIFRNVSLATTLLTARAMHSLVIEKEGRLAYVSLKASDYTETGCLPQNSGELVDIARNIEGVKISFFFYETRSGKETKVSIRSAEPFDAIELAGKFGGGGHPRAAGCSLEKPLEETRGIILAEVDRIWHNI